MEPPNDHYDSPWKEAIEHYFQEFMAFYFPDAYRSVDWSKEHIFLDQELRAIVQDAELGTRFVDKLVRVTELSGSESWIYIHVEVQGTRQTEFSKRMFVYNYRIFDRYEKPVASLAVLADQHKHWKQTSYGYNVLGCRLTLDFPVAKLTDYDEKLDELLASENAFGLITAAHIWDKQRVINLLTVVDWLMTLPAWLDTKVWQEIETIEEHKNMKYITSIERIGIAKGRVEGRIEGRVEGRVEGESKLLKRQLERRFGALPAWAIELLSNANEPSLEAWGVAILTAQTLEAVFNSEASH